MGLGELSSRKLHQLEVNVYCFSQELISTPNDRPKRDFPAGRAIQPPAFAANLGQIRRPPMNRTTLFALFCSVVAFYGIHQAQAIEVGDHAPCVELNDLQPSGE